MRDYLANPSLYYDSTDKLFVVPEGRTEDLVVLQRRKENGERERERLRVRPDVTKKGHDHALFFSFSVSRSLFLLCIMLVLSISRRVGANRAGQQSRGIFTATTRVTSSERTVEKSSREEMPTRYFLLVIQRRATCAAFVIFGRCLSLITEAFAQC